MRKLALVLLLVSVSSAAFADNFRQDDIVYASPDGIDLKLDLMGPGGGDGPFPAVLFFPGNSFGFDDDTRRQCLGHLRDFAAAGYVALEVDVRSSRLVKGGKTAYPHPLPLYDAKAAVRWLRANAAKYKVDTERIGVAGWSSGAYFALMLALTRPEDGLEGDVGITGYSTAIRAAAITGRAVNFDYDGIEKYSEVAAYIGSSRAEMPEAFRVASPIRFLRKGAPPILQFEGEEDPPNVDQAPSFHAQLEKLGVPHRLIIVPLGGHADYLDAAECIPFFDRYLKGAQQ